MDQSEVTRRAQERAARTAPGARHRVPAPDSSLLPPGPRLPRIVQSSGTLRFRHRFIPWAHRRYGDVFTLRLLPGDRPIVYFSRPEAIRDIFAGDPDVFHAGEANSILGPVMGEHSLLLVDGAEHRRARTLLLPAFSTRALRGYEALVTEVAKTEVLSWQPGVPFRSLDRMNSLTLQVIMRVVFGVTDEERLVALRPLIRSVVDVNPAVLLGWALPPLRRIGMWRRAADAVRDLDLQVYDLIGERRAAADLDTRTDVLSRLIRVDADGDHLSDAELRDQMVTLLLAGHETTATALAWALQEVGHDEGQLAQARHVGWRQRCQVVGPKQEPARVGGVDLPAGTTVAASILLAHSSPDNHPDPTAFRPARFTGTAPPANTWLPFGGGVRRCIGAGFSLMEGVTVLREVLTTYDVHAIADEAPRVRNITSVPRGGARIVVRAAP